MSSILVSPLTTGMPPSRTTHAVQPAGIGWRPAPKREISTAEAGWRGEVQRASRSDLGTTLRSRSGSLPSSQDSTRSLPVS